MSESNIVDLRKEWEKLSTPDLEAMLQTELEKQVPDDDVVLLLLRILESREPDQLPELTDREKAAFELYKQRVRSRRKKRFFLPRWLSVAACGAVILGMLFTVMPQKAEAETFWEMLQRLSDTVFEFFSREEKFSVEGYPFQTDNPGLQQVYDAVVELGITDPMMPMWLPDGYEMVQLESKDTPMLKGMWARFSCEKGEIVYRLNVFDGEPAHQVYRDDAYYDSYERNGITFHITQNNDRWTVVWSKENIECLLTLDCQEDTLRRILKSIYVMED